MKSVCFYFKIHQPYRLKRYRFFDIGNDHYYYDDFANDEIITRLAENSYMPLCDTLLEMIRDTNGAFHCSIDISGTAIEQLQMYVPECIDKLKALADTGCVEFLAGPYAYSLASLEDPEEFLREVRLHERIIKNTFGVKTKVFANTELIYDDDIATLIKAMGYNTCVTEGAKHILGWKSPNYVYTAATEPNLKLLLTTWTHGNTGLNDYAHRQLAEMMSTYYLPRWQRFFREKQQELSGDAPVETSVTAGGAESNNGLAVSFSYEQNAGVDEIQNLFWKSDIPLLTEAQGDIIALAEQILNR